MTGHFTLSTALLSGLLLVAPAHAGNYTQLAAAAGITESEAAGMTLTEIHARKINREARGDDKVTVSSREYPALATGQSAQLAASAGVSQAEAARMSLTELAALKANRDGGHDNGIPVLPPRSAAFDARTHPQLVAAAGLSVDEAVGMSLDEIYRGKVNREARGDDRQRAAE